MTKNVEIKNKLSNKKVAIFHDYFRVLGGAERLVIDLARNINADIITSEIKDNMFELVKSYGIKVISLGEKTLIPSLLPLITSKRFSKCNFEKQYDLYIFSGSFSIYAAENHKPNMWYCHTPLKGLYHE